MSKYEKSESVQQVKVKVGNMYFSQAKKVKVCNKWTWKWKLETMQKPRLNQNLHKRWGSHNGSRSTNRHQHVVFDFFISFLHSFRIFALLYSSRTLRLSHWPLVKEYIGADMYSNVFRFCSQTAEFNIFPWFRATGPGSNIAFHYLQLSECRSSKYIRVRVGNNRVFLYNISAFWQYFW